MLCLQVGLAPGATAAEPPVQPVTIARATAIPDCTLFVDAVVERGEGTAAAPLSTIAEAVEVAEAGAVICVAEGVYAEKLAPGDKPLTLAGGFKSGSGFATRDSAKYPSRAQGNGSGSFLRVEDPAPAGGLTVVDGFDISGYSQAIYRAFWESQRFDVTNNHIHDNTCSEQALAGGGVALDNVSGTIRGNVLKNNSCGRGGALFLNDGKNENSVVVEGNRFESNSGTEPDAAHGGGVYLFGNLLTIVGNLFIANTVTQWGGGLFVGAYTPGNQTTTAKLAWNVYRGNRAGNSGGGFFCDDGATCIAAHEIYDRNCGGNIMVDGGAGGSGPTTARFDHITVVGALEPDCKTPGPGLFVNTWEAQAADDYTVSNAIFWANGADRDIATACESGCKKIKLSVSHSMLAQRYQDGSIKARFGAGILEPADPAFVDLDGGDLRLRPGSPVIGKGSDGRDLGAQAGVADDGGPNALTVPPEPRKADPGRPKASKGSKPAAVPEKLTKRSLPDTGSAKQAFEDAKELGTHEAWDAFLGSYPEGFYADLARAYLQKLPGP